MVEVYQHFRGMYCCLLNDHRVSQESNQQSALKMDAVYSSPSKTSVVFYQTTQHHILGDIALHNN
jgi:hypothetical protein